MQLNYRSVPYQAPAASVVSIPTEETAVFLGLHYHCRYASKVPQHASKRLTYRGISYQQ